MIYVLNSERDNRDLYICISIFNKIDEKSIGVIQKKIPNIYTEGGSDSGELISAYVDMLNSSDYEVPTMIVLAKEFVSPESKWTQLIDNDNVCLVGMIRKKAIDIDDVVKVRRSRSKHPLNISYVGHSSDRLLIMEAYMEELNTTRNYFFPKFVEESISNLSRFRKQKLIRPSFSFDELKKTLNELNVHRNTIMIMDTENAPLRRLNKIHGALGFKAEKNFFIFSKPLCQKETNYVFAFKRFSNTLCNIRTSKKDADKDIINIMRGHTGKIETIVIVSTDSDFAPSINAITLNPAFKCIVIVDSMSKKRMFMKLRLDRTNLKIIAI